jgi:hypothetical protein
LNPYRVLEFGDPELVIIKRRGEVSSRHITERNGDWCLLYQDGLAQVWGAAKRFDDPASEDYLSIDRRQISDNIPEGVVPWPALPAKTKNMSAHQVAKN